MQTVNIHEAKTNLSKLIAKAVKGESFIIAKAGKPMVRVVAIDAPEPKPVRRLGFMKGQLKIPKDFDTMCAKEIEEMFYGKS
jgi:prevent-host-death family protein